MTRIGALISAAVPCAPLLIHDLGDRKRFHHLVVGPALRPLVTRRIGRK